jgi:signal transduction histidine kinase
MKNPELATLLRINQDEITAAWANSLQDLPDSQYKRYSPAILETWAEQWLAGIIEILISGSSQFLDEYVGEVVNARIKAGFPIYEVTEGLLLSKEAISPIIWSSYSANSQKAIESIIQLDIILRQIITRFTHLFSDSMHHQLFTESRLRLSESESLQRTTTGLLEKLDLDEVLEIVSSEACRLTGATGSAVLLLEDEDWFNVTISTGQPLPILDRLPVEDSLAGMAVEQETHLLVNTLPDQIQAYHRNRDLESILVVPLRVKDTIIGVLDVVNKSMGFSEDDVRILNLFATQAAIAIENARLREQAEQLAVLEERQRLARELHDSVTQALYSVNLYANATELALSSGKMDIAIENLHELNNMAREAMLDMRTLIFELHPPVLEKVGLVAALRTRLEAVEARSGIQTSIHVEGERRLPLSLETELYRLAQEILTNAVKHSKANEVTLRMRFEEQRLYFEMRDDGIGFDLMAASQSGGLGIQSMQERANQIDGELTIESTPGEGTSVRVVVEV